MATPKDQGMTQSIPYSKKSGAYAVTRRQPHNPMLRPMPPTGYRQPPLGLSRNQSSRQARATVTLHASSTGSVFGHHSPQFGSWGWETAAVNDVPANAL